MTMLFLGGGAASMCQKLRTNLRLVGLRLSLQTHKELFKLRVYRKLFHFNLQYSIAEKGLTHKPYFPPNAFVMAGFILAAFFTRGAMPSPCLMPVASSMSLWKSLPFQDTGSLVA